MAAASAVANVPRQSEEYIALKRPAPVLNTPLKPVPPLDVRCSTMPGKRANSLSGCGLTLAACWA
eukprot:CAMPEP_0185381442 /NCGR_PEP_ID=MMETSP1364-20130426/52764_1 /TAXON_ID=38817 /ORGANISM="Gephyrocapsa oceanica, Strain RCC1303" /LENGTH=64 /DNA_ID=CAMNT_0027983103 /DNA_START=18 /DNA_END=212 /DNA_ORIENTATION=+